MSLSPSSRAQLRKLWIPQLQIKGFVVTSIITGEIIIGPKTIGSIVVNQFSVRSRYSSFFNPLKVEGARNVNLLPLSFKILRLSKSTNIAFWIIWSRFCERSNFTRFLKFSKPEIPFDLRKFARRMSSSRFSSFSKAYFETNWRWFEAKERFLRFGRFSNVPLARLEKVFPGSSRTSSFSRSADGNFVALILFPWNTANLKS